MIFKILGTVLLTALAGVLAFIVFVYSAFLFDLFYWIWLPVIVLVLYFVALSFIWRWFRLKTRLIVIGSLAGALILAPACYAVNGLYTQSITISDRGVDLELYEPFRKGTKTIAGNVDSQLKLTDNLPKLDGATALYPLYSAFVQAVYPQGDYDVFESEVVCSNTLNAYYKLTEGQVDIIFAAAPSADQIDLAAHEGVEFTLTPIGKEAFVFFVNSKNPVDNLSVDEIRGIYSGKITDWREVGGNTANIKAYQRPFNSGSQTMLEKIMADTAIMQPPSENVAGGMGDIISEVSSYRNNKNALGYSFLYYATEMVKDSKIKLLAVNGVQPTRETIADATYPYADYFYAVTTGAKSENTAKLIEWILSEQGQDIVERVGYTRLK